MTKKDYQLLANWIEQLQTSFDSEETRHAHRHMIGDLCDTLQIDNPRFNRNKFLAACGIS